MKPGLDRVIRNLRLAADQLDTAHRSIERAEGALATVDDPQVRLALEWLSTAKSALRGDLVHSSGQGEDTPDVRARQPAAVAAAAQWPRGADDSESADTRRHGAQPAAPLPRADSRALTRVPTGDEQIDVGPGPADRPSEPPTRIATATDYRDREHEPGCALERNHAGGCATPIPGTDGLSVAGEVDEKGNYTPNRARMPMMLNPEARASLMETERSGRDDGTVRSPAPGRARFPNAPINPLAGRELEPPTVLASPEKAVAAIAKVEAARKREGFLPQPVDVDVDSDDSRTPVPDRTWRCRDGEDHRCALHCPLPHGFPPTWDRSQNCGATDDEIPGDWMCSHCHSSNTVSCCDDPAIVWVTRAAPGPHCADHCPPAGRPEIL